nr:hypothetical protein [Psychrobacter sp. PraFG1]UNK05254.1 hypothetical protein MN210_15180 [Psychrobacter sp. PraFG1]
MRIELLDNLTGKWAMQWIVAWFVFGVIALSTGFWLTTEHTRLDWFYLGVSLVGLVCVVSSRSAAMLWATAWAWQPLPVR